MLVNNDNVWFEICHTQVMRNGSSSRGLPAGQVTINCVFAGIHIGDDELDEVVVPPGVLLAVEHDAAAV